MMIKLTHCRVGRIILGLLTESVLFERIKTALRKSSRIAEECDTTPMVVNIESQCVKAVELSGARGYEMERG